MTVPDWLLERYAVDEVTPEERAAIEADPDLGAQLAALRGSNEAIAESWSARDVARIAAERGRPSPAVRCPLLLAPLATAAAALVWIALPPSDGHRAKGLELALTVYRQTADGAETLTPGTVAHAGDRLQLEYTTEQPFGWLVSIDGAGAVTLHNDGHLQPGVHRLATAIELDDAPRFEHFFLVASDEPIDRTDVLERAEAFATDPEVGFDLPAATEVDVRVDKP